MQSIQKNLNLSRNAIKGIAILWVIFFHAQLGLNGILYEIQKIGYGGVDIFLFLSGYGLYRSLSRDQDLARYLKRRAARLLPVYLPFCLLWFAVMFPLLGRVRLDSVVLRIIAGNLSMMGFFSGSPEVINWYVSMLALTVLSAPLFAACLRPGKHYWLRAAMLLAVLFVLGAAYIKNAQYMAFSRFPVFVIGMIFARPYKSETAFPLLKWGLAAAFLAGVAALYFCFARMPDLLNAYAMYWHPFVLITPALCAGLGWLFVKCPSALRAPFEVLGRASFEIFLFNAWLEVLGKRFGIVSTPLEWAAGSLVMIAIGLLYHWIVGKFVQKVVDKRA